MSTRRAPDARGQTELAPLRATHAGGRWHEYDVVVAGYGYAGGMAAIAAADAGARVALFEKMPDAAISEAEGPVIHTARQRQM